MEISELKAALIRLDELRREREKKLTRADEIEDNCLSVGTSRVFDNIGASFQRSRHSPQERMIEAVDLRRSALNDYMLLWDMRAVLEDELKQIPDMDTRTIIDYCYIKGWSIDEIASLFEESGGTRYVYEVIDRFFVVNM